MEPLLATLALLLFGGAAIWGSRQKGAKKRTETWREAAVSCGLLAVEAPTVEAPSLWYLPIEAETKPVKVWIEHYKKYQGQPTASIRIVVEPPGPPDFHAVTIRAPKSPVLWAREIEIGDSPFDKTFLIEGPRPMVFALFDADTRRLLLNVNSYSKLSISSGVLSAEMGDEVVPGLLPILVYLGRHLAQLKDIPRRLAENARQDPVDEVRLQILLVLTQEFPQSPWTREALRTACSDPAPQVRLRAAKQLGAEGHRALLELAESPVDDAFRAEAISILDQELPFESARAIVDSAKGLRHLRTIRACLKVLGRSGVASAVDVLTQVLAGEKGEMATVAAQALGTLGNPAAEPALILALQREEEDLQVAAANALGRVGSVAAVPPLKEAAEHFPLDFDFRQATRQAIAEIQSRLQGASPGQLSLAGAEAGQLSLAQAEAGQLSIATDQGGQISISGAEETIEKA